jgi:hypothetical protein
MLKKNLKDNSILEQYEQWASKKNRNVDIDFFFWVKI